MLTVINCQVFSLNPTDDESEICPRSTACEAIRYPSVTVGSPLDKQFVKLPWFLLIPGYTSTHILTGLAGHGDHVSY